MPIFKGVKTRTFKGKRYRYEFELIRKSSAEQYAKTLREEGKEARITYEGKVVGWVVWSRIPKGKEVKKVGKGYAGTEGTTHARAKELAKKYRKRGYGAFIKKSGDKWYVYRTEHKESRRRASTNQRTSRRASISQRTPRITPKVGRLR